MSCAQPSASDSERGQINTGAAEVYEEFFLPALFTHWPPRLAEAARIRAGRHVLDVACGTGVLARALLERVGPEGSVTGLDINPGMLAVARRKEPKVDWRQGPAEALPFADRSFDAVVSQFGLMFFDNRRAAIAEMMRVLKPGGRLAVAVWAALDTSPGYAALLRVLQDLFGDAAADALRAPFNLGDPAMLRSLFADAGVPGVEVATYAGIARYPSIEAWMYTEIKGWTLADMIDDAQYQRLLDTAKQVLRQFAGPNGAVSFSAPALIATAEKA